MSIALSPTSVGKFIRVVGRRFLVKGVSYGTFAPDAEGWQFPPPERVADDFATMARFGINTVRLYTPPSPALLDEAAGHGLRVMVGLPWSQHVAFLDDSRLCRQIRRDVEQQVRRLRSHPAVLLFAIGNEIPSSMVRWHGRRNVERFLRDLYATAKSAAPDSLITYVNYPPTDYLELPFLDVAAFNVYLHKQRELRAYVARLHHIVGNKPLLLAEAGADSIRQSEERQAALTAMQLRVAYNEGACGAIAFSWTDEWWRGGTAVEDWAFGLVDRDRRPKLALHAAQRVFDTAPFRSEQQRAWPRVSVVVCVHNGADTLDECLIALDGLSYQDYEVIVVDDGSTDASPEIARRHSSVQLVQVPSGGLSAARNSGLTHATGEIVAYIDADARAEPEWLAYLVQPFMSSSVAGSGGPNVVPDDDSWLAQMVARAPGGPSHVLLDDRVAEHVPGCNMAFRRDVLLALDGFNSIFRKAGDDVDFCWRVQARGWKIGFAPCALVWHRHRASVGAFWRQQVGYGEAEIWLKAVHPGKFVGLRAIWRGHIYSALPFVRSLRREKVNVGVWGSAAFPSVYRVDAHPIAHLPHSGRWQVASLALVAVGGAAFGTPVPALGFFFCGVGAAGLGLTIAKCFLYAARTDIDALPPIGRLPRRASRMLSRLTLAWLHYVQPLSRLHGRILGILAPTRSRQPVSPRTTDMPAGQVMPQDVVRGLRLLTGASVQERYWSERWVSVDSLLGKMTDWLRLSRAVDMIEVDDGWRANRDFSVAIDRWVWLDLRAVVEEHGGGRCLLRVATRARPTRLGGAVAGLGVLGIGTAGVLAGWSAASFFGLALFGAALPASTWRVLRTASVVREALAKVTAEGGLTPMPRDRSRFWSGGWVGARRRAGVSDADGPRPASPPPRDPPVQIPSQAAVVRPRRLPRLDRPLAHRVPAKDARSDRDESFEDSFRGVARRAAAGAAPGSRAGKQP